MRLDLDQWFPTFGSWQTTKHNKKNNMATHILQQKNFWQPKVSSIGNFISQLCLNFNFHEQKMNCYVQEWTDRQVSFIVALETCLMAIHLNIS